MFFKISSRSPAYGAGTPASAWLSPPRRAQRRALASMRRSRVRARSSRARAVAATGCRGQGTLMVEPGPSSVEDELVPPPSKKSKYKSKFHPEWEMEFAVSPS